MTNPCLVKNNINSGIRTNKPQQTEEELKKVTQMVKNNDYTHKEIGVLRENDLRRIKVNPHLFRKLSEGLPRKSLSKKRGWPKKKNSISLLWPRLNVNKC